MKTIFTLILTLCAALCQANGRNTIYDTNVKTLQVVVNKDWLSPAVMELKSSDVLHISFDEMSHDYHRFVYKIEHCEADWSVSDGLFESDYIDFKFIRQKAIFIRSIFESLFRKRLHF